MIVMQPLIALFGATASGKTALALALAQEFGGEVLSCDSVAVYRGMEVGTAKPSPAERRLVPHHLLDLYDPTEACSAGDYARHARSVLGGMKALPILAGGTGLYARALLDGLFPAPPRDQALRDLLRGRAETRGPQHLHRTLARLDRRAAALIHANDVSKVIRAIEVSLAMRRPMTEQWEAGREGLTGYRVLRLILQPERAELYGRIDERAAGMFARGLVDETRGLIARFGCRVPAIHLAGLRRGGGGAARRDDRVGSDRTRAAGAPQLCQAADDLVSPRGRAACLAVSARTRRFSSDSDRGKGVGGKAS